MVSIAPRCWRSDAAAEFGLQDGVVDGWKNSGTGRTAGWAESQRIYAFPIGGARDDATILSEQAYWQVKARLDLAVSDLGAQTLKNIAEPARAYSLEVGEPAQVKPTKPAAPKQRSMFVLAAG